MGAGPAGVGPPPVIRVTSPRPGMVLRSRESGPHGSGSRSGPGPELGAHAVSRNASAWNTASDPATSDPAPDPVREAVAQAHRTDWAAVLAATIRVTRDLDTAEECVQDAYAQALRTWPNAGVPSRPAAWLTTVAANRARDLLRRESVERRALPRLVVEEAVADPSTRAPAARTPTRPPPSPTTACGSSSPAATPRSPGRRRSR